MSPELLKSTISESRLEANRANAQLSTGPATPEGKQRSAMNAWRHGLTGQVALMPGEDRDEFNRFCKSIVEDYHPEGPIENQLAHSIAEDFWRLNRGRAWETNTLAYGHFNGMVDRVDADIPQVGDAMTQVLVFEKQAVNFARIALYEQRINRNIARNEASLKTRQAERRAALAEAVAEAKLLEDEAKLLELEPETTEEDPSAEPHSHFVFHNGFVFSKANIAFLIGHERRLERARRRLLTLQKAA